MIFLFLSVPSYNVAGQEIGTSPGYCVCICILFNVVKLVNDKCSTQKIKRNRYKNKLKLEIPLPVMIYQTPFSVEIFRLGNLSPN